MYSPDKVFRRHDDLLTRQAAEDLRYYLMNRLFVAGLQLVLVTSIKEVTRIMSAYYSSFNTTKRN